MEINVCCEQGLAVIDREYSDWRPVRAFRSSSAILVLFAGILGAVVPVFGGVVDEPETASVSRAGIDQDTIIHAIGGHGQSQPCAYHQPGEGSGHRQHPGL